MEHTSGQGVGAQSHTRASSASMTNDQSARLITQTDNPRGELAPGLQALEVSQALVDHEGEETSPAFRRHTGDGGGDEDVAQIKQRRVERQWLGVEHV